MKINGFNIIKTPFQLCKAENIENIGNHMGLLDDVTLDVTSSFISTILHKVIFARGNP